MKLKILDRFPEGLTTAPAEILCEELGGPTLIHMKGRRERPLFVTVLLHGNETTGWLAIREIMNKYNGRGLPRSMSIFIGNVDAAAAHMRRLDDQVDYNRIWRHCSLLEGHLAREVVNEMLALEVFASVDIHNNTGRNPHYSIVSKLDRDSLYLASVFDRKVIYFTSPDSTLTNVFADICPAVTLEAGLPDQAFGVEHAVNYIDGCLHLDHFPEAPVSRHDLELYHSVAMVKPADGVSFGFCEEDVDLCFPEELDRLNFQLLPKGATLGRYYSPNGLPLEVWNEKGDEVGADYLTVKEGEVRLVKPVMPSMLTLSIEAIRQDCLCYFLEQIDHTRHLTS